METVPLERNELMTELNALSQRMTRWVLGTGMLAFHAGLFALSATSLILWNVYSSPSDLWVAELLRRWGAVLAFHAILIAAGLAAWRLLHAPVADDAPARIDESTRSMQTAPSALAPRPSEPFSAPVWPATPVESAPETAITEWKGEVGRRTKVVVSAAAARWAALRQAADGAKAETTSPGNVWPAPTPNDHHGDGALFGRSSDASTADDASRHADRVVTHEPAGNARPDSDWSIHTTPADGTSTAPTRWTWVEAAAASWIARQEDGEPTIDPLTASPDGSVPPPPS